MTFFSSNSTVASCLTNACPPVVPALAGWIMIVVAAAIGPFAASPLRAQLMDSEMHVFDAVGVDQNLGMKVPDDLTFVDSDGRRVMMGDLMGGVPVILNLVYYECPMLCNMTTDSLVKALRTLPFQVGREFDVVTVSFNPHEGPAQAARTKRTILRRYGGQDAEPHWHFLTGDSEQIERLTSTVGFRYTFDATTGQYAHASTLIILTPDGRVSRYLQGIEVAPRDLRLSLVDASADNIGSLTDQVLLLCYQYNPLTGKYGLVVDRALRTMGIATVLGILGAISVFLYRERRNRHMSQEPGGAT